MFGDEIKHRTKGEKKGLRLFKYFDLHDTVQEGTARNVIIWKNKCATTTAHRLNNVFSIRYYNTVVAEGTALNSVGTL